MKKTLACVLPFVVVVIFFAVWRMFVSPASGGGTWEVTTASGKTEVDALFVYRQSPNSVSEAWNLIKGDLNVRQYHAGKERKLGDRDFKRSVQIAKTASERVMRMYQVRGEGELSVTWAKDGFAIAEGESIISINGGPASIFLWREALESAVSDGSGRRPAFVYPIYLLVKDLEGNVRPVVLEAYLTGYRGYWRAYAPMGVKELNGVDDRVALPDSDMSGPSAGLAMALGFFNQSTGMCFSLGGKVAATGQITELGAVLGVGGVREKTEAALRSGNELLLVPEANYAEAYRASGGRIKVVAVSSVADAVEKIMRNEDVNNCFSRAQIRDRMLGEY